MSLFDRFSLSGKRLFLTGGSRGLGREMALALAEAGADVILTGRDLDSLHRTADEIRALGRDAEMAFAVGLYRRIHNDWRAEWIEAEYLSSGKNAQASDFWTRAGLRRLGIDMAAAQYRSDRSLAELAQTKPEYVTLVVD